MIHYLLILMFKLTSNKILLIIFLKIYFSIIFVELLFNKYEKKNM